MICCEYMSASFQLCCGRQSSPRKTVEEDDDNDDDDDDAGGDWDDFDIDVPSDDENDNVDNDNNDDDAKNAETDDDQQKLVDGADVSLGRASRFDERLFVPITQELGPATDDMLVCNCFFSMTHTFSH
jgi:hypothetical protein